MVVVAVLADERVVVPAQGGMQFREEPVEATLREPPGLKAHVGVEQGTHAGPAGFDELVPRGTDQAGQRREDLDGIAEQVSADLAVGRTRGVVQGSGDLGGDLAGRGVCDPGQIVLEGCERPGWGRGQEVRGVAASGLQQGDRPQVDSGDLAGDRVQPAPVLPGGLRRQGEPDRRQRLEGRRDCEAAAQQVGGAESEGCRDGWLLPAESERFGCNRISGSSLATLPGWAGASRPAARNEGDHHA